MSSNFLKEKRPALIVEGPEAVGTEVEPEARRTEWHQLWIGLRRWQWTSLAVVPASPTNWTLRVARSLVRVGSIHVRAPVQLVDATEVKSEAVRATTDYLDDFRNTPRLAVLACPHPSLNEAAIPLILSADAVLLAVVLDESSFNGTQQVLKLFGPRIVGSVVLPKAK